MAVRDLINKWRDEAKRHYSEHTGGVEGLARTRGCCAKRLPKWFAF